MTGEKKNRSFASIMLGGTFGERLKLVLVADLAPGMPASASGLSVGDQVLSVNGEPLESAIQANAALQMAPAGDVVLQVQRDASAKPAKGGPSQPEPVVGVPVG